jgi:hypothetical protein
MTSLTPPHRTQAEAQRFLHLSTRQLVDLVLRFLERPQFSPHASNRALDPLRAELRRREVAGWDDPFHPIHDPVTQS